MPASIRACEGLAAKYARQVDTTNQGLSVGASKRMEHYLRLADDLREREATVAEVFLGGSTFSDAEKLDDDSNLIRPAFRRGMDEWAPRSDAPDWYGGGR